MKRSHPSTPKLERSTVERNRRIHMRNLCNELASLIPPQHHSRVGLSQPHVLEQATDYIKKMEGRINELRSRKKYLTTDHRTSEIIDREMSGAMMIDSTQTMVEVSESGSALNVVLISSLNKDVMLSDVVIVLKEGAEVLSTNQYFVADRCHVYSTLRLKAPEWVMILKGFVRDSRN